ncbi:DUF1552 domain-containing protein [Haliangium sp.]|uniref:DUF1552 domain-containing protein n=1 Tax=Haliangium sp. TaxID=2663208 RepID=UPI003D10DEF6
MKRRQFLRGAFGVAIGLPMLSSLRFFRGRAVAASTEIERRMIIFFTCNGVDMDRFWPADFGTLSASSFDGTALAALSGHYDKLLLPRGIHMVPRGFGWDPSNGDDHAKGMGHKLTAQPLAAGSGYATGVSVDQRAAEYLHPGTPSLSLLVGRSSSGVLGHISYRGSEQPVSPEGNPWLTYQDLFTGDGSGDKEALLRLRDRRQSVLDLCRPEYEELMRQDLSRDDRDKLDMHFTAIRDLEVDIDGDGCALDPARVEELQQLDPATVGYDSQFRAVGRMQMDILALAIACGKTQVATLQWGSGAGGPIFTWDGMTHDYNHHKLSHGNTKDDDSGSPVDGYLDMIHDIDRWYAGEFAYLLDRLNSYAEGDGTVLDHSSVVWTNELSHGKDHDFRDLPYVMAGNCCDYFKTGRYVKVTAQDNPRNDTDAPHNKLLTTMLNAVGVREEDGSPVANFGHPDFGDPGEFDELKA